MISCQNSPVRPAFNIKSLILALTVAIFMVSCEEDPSQIGVDVLLLSDFDKIVATDTFNVDLFTVLSDTASSSFSTITFLGTISDPYFGLSTADFVTQLWLAAEWPGEGFSVDSVMLTLDIDDVSGNITDRTINIHEISEKLDRDSIYLVNKSVQIEGLLASFEFPSIPEGSDTTISIHLPVSFGEYVLRDTSQLYLRSDTAVDFRDFIKGIYFEYPQTSEHQMLKLNILGGYSNIVVYFTNASGYDRSYRFTLNQSCVNYRRYTHDYEYAAPDKRIMYINQSVEDSLAYAQSMQGVFIKLVIPGLEDLKDKMPVSINKARLSLPAYLNDDDYDDDMVPDYLFARYDSSGVRRVLSDYLLNPAFMDGTYSQLNDLFTLNIANFVQQYLEGEIEKPEIEIYLSEYSSKNLILRSGEGEKGVKLELSYTDLN